MTISAITTVVREIINDNVTLVNCNNVQKDSVRGLLSGLCMETIWGLKLLSSILKSIQYAETQQDKMQYLRDIRNFAVCSFKEFEIYDRVERLYARFLPAFPTTVLSKNSCSISSPKELVEFLNDSDCLFLETMEEELIKINNTIQSSTASDDVINEAINSTLTVFDKHIRKLKESERSINDYLSEGEV